MASMNIPFLYEFWVEMLLTAEHCLNRCLQIREKWLSSSDDDKWNYQSVSTFQHQLELSIKMILSRENVLLLFFCCKITCYPYAGVGIFLYPVFSVREDLITVIEPPHSFNLVAADGTALKDHLIDELDYNLVPKDAWFKLVSWYGVISEEQALPRKVVEHGMYVKSCKVEVYLMQLKLSQDSDPKTIVTRQFSKGDTVGRLCYLIYSVFKVNAWNCMKIN